MVRALAAPIETLESTWMNVSDLSAGMQRCMQDHSQHSHIWSMVDDNWLACMRQEEKVDRIIDQPNT